MRYLGSKPDVGANEFVTGGNHPPVPAFTALPQANKPLVAQFDASDSVDPDGKILRYDWDFGDGNTLRDGPARVGHEYAHPGRYSVTLRVVDDAAAPLQSAASLGVSVGKPALSVDATRLQFGLAGKELPLTLWNSADGTLVYSISTSADWLTLSDDSGNCTSQSDRVMVQADRSKLKIGEYEATITIDAGAGGTYELPVSLVVPTVRKIKLIRIGDEWRFHKGKTRPAKAWKAAGYDDTDWTVGPSGIGYSSGLKYATNLSDMRGNYLAVFMRRQFEIEDLSTVLQLKLAIRYDDGFIAYINGKEVARSLSMGRPGKSIGFNRPAIAKHDEEDPEEFYTIEVGQDLFRQGKNVLAIEFHNAATKSTDACAVPRLIASVVGEPHALASVSGSITLAGGLVGGLTLLGMSLRSIIRRYNMPRLAVASAKSVNRAAWMKYWRRLNGVAVAVVVGGIVVLSCLPPRFIQLGLHDKKMHALAYGVLAFTLFSAIKSRGLLVRILAATLGAIDRYVGVMKLAVIFFVVTVMGGGLEIVQHFTGRHMSVRDFIANVLGAGAVICVCLGVSGLWRVVSALLAKTDKVEHIKPAIKVVQPEKQTLQPPAQAA